MNLRHFIVLLFTSASLQAADLALVLIDKDTEAKHGKFPFDRALTAQAVEKIAAAGAKTIILKFFYDKDRSEASDTALQNAICKNKVILQASMDIEGHKKPLPEKFIVANAPPFAELLSSEAALLPIPRFLNCAHDVGFVDLADPAVALLYETYREKAVKSLYLCALEALTEKPAVFEAPNTIKFGDKKLRLNEDGVFPLKLGKPAVPTYHKFHDILEKPDDELKSKLNNTVVIVGYNGDQIHTIETEQGPIKAHLYFIAALKNMLESLSQ